MTATRTALVTGAAGFVGRHMTAALAAAGWDVAGVDLDAGALHDTDQHLAATLPPSMVGTQDGYPRLYAGDARDLLDWDRFDLVVHAAAVVGGRTFIDGNPAELAAYDLELDAVLWRYALARRPGRVVYLSSSAVYPVAFQNGHPRRLAEADARIPEPHGLYLAPDQTYGWVKLTGERVAAEVRRAGVPVTVVRPFSGYGADQDPAYPFRAFIDRARERRDPFTVWGDGCQVRDFVHISDIVAAILRLVDAGVDGPVNIGTGRPVSFNELAYIVTRAAGYHPELRHEHDAPTGVRYRVADTGELARYYTPTVRLEDAIAEALR